MNKITMLLLLLIVSLCTITCSDANAEQVIHYNGQSQALQSRFDWARQEGNKSNGYWIGYSIQRLMGPGEIFISGSTFNGRMKLDGPHPSIEELVTGKPTPREFGYEKGVKETAQDVLAKLEKNKRAETKVLKDIGILLHFKKGASTPYDLQMMNMVITVDLEKQPLLWLGKADLQQSFQLLKPMYDQLKDAELKEDVLAAISCHDQIVDLLPFLRQILQSNDPVDCRELAAILAGDIATQESLDLLKATMKNDLSEDVREGALIGISEMNLPAAEKALMDFALHYGDNEVRETAIALLADKETPEAINTLRQLAWSDPDSDVRETAVYMLGEIHAAGVVDALLKIATEHPNSETRKAAVYSLAENNDPAAKKAVKNLLHK